MILIMEKKQLSKILFSIFRVCVIVVLALSVLYAVILLSFTAYVTVRRDSWDKKMKTISPWAEQAIWKSTEDNMYLICTEEEAGDSSSIVVKAYVKVQDEWLPADLGCRSSAVRRGYLGLLEGDAHLEGDMRLKENTLTLSKIERYGYEFMGTCDKIVLEKYDYDSMIDKLPFALD